MAGYTLQLSPITATLCTIQDKKTLKYRGLKAEYLTNFSLYSNFCILLVIAKERIRCLFCNSKGGRRTTNGDDGPFYQHMCMITTV